MAYLLAGCQALLLAVFAASGVGKVRGRVAWSGFVRSVQDLRLVPPRLVAYAAAGTVAVELVLVPLLAVPATALAGLVLAAALLVVFTVSILVTARRGVRAACHCFGRATGSPLGTRHVVRNGALLAVAALGVGAGWGTGGGPVPSWTGAHPAGLAIAAVAGLAGALVLIFFEEIVELFTGPGVGAGQPEQGST